MSIPFVGGVLAAALVSAAIAAPVYFVALRTAPPAAQSVLTVTSTDDTYPYDLTCSPYPGHCSLRDAVAKANQNPGDDTIDFHSSVTGTIVLTSPLPILSGQLTISGRVRRFSASTRITPGPSYKPRGLSRLRG